MNKEEKVQFAKELYSKLNLENYTLESKRDEEIKADYIWVSNMRGPGGLIIGDDGTFLFCQSAHDFEYWKEQYKKGVRTEKK